LRFAANLDYEAFAFVEPPAARHDFACGQKSRPIAADIDEHSLKRRH
jgi:hypothetical protein